MGKFNRGDRGGFGGYKRQATDRGFKQGERERLSMHRAICSECGRPCEVPFRPSGDKPVFCSDCFGRRESGGDSRSERRDSFRPERKDSREFSFEEKRLFRAICDKCHKECEVPFKPNGEKPVFCSDCFGQRDKGTGGGNVAISDVYKKQFETINSKLDYILKLLSPKSSGEMPAKTAKAAAAQEEKKIEKTVEVKKEAAPKKEIASKKENAPKKKIASKKGAAPKKAAKKVTAKKK